jgi:hypothetical protein
MRIKPLKTRDLILSLSKDEAKIMLFRQPAASRKNIEQDAIAAAYAGAVHAPHTR